MEDNNELNDNVLEWFYIQMRNCNIGETSCAIRRDIIEDSIYYRLFNKHMPENDCSNYDKLNEYYNLYIKIYEENGYIKYAGRDEDAYYFKDNKLVPYKEKLYVITDKILRERQEQKRIEELNKKAQHQMDIQNAIKISGAKRVGYKRFGTIPPIYTNPDCYKPLPMPGKSQDELLWDIVLTAILLITRIDAAIIPAIWIIFLAHLRTNKIEMRQQMEIDYLRRNHKLF